MAPLHNQTGVTMKKVILLVILGYVLGCVSSPQNIQTAPQEAVSKESEMFTIFGKKGSQFAVYVIRDNETEKEYIVAKIYEGIAITPRLR